MARIDFNQAWQDASRWLKQGLGLLFARPAMWLCLAVLESLATTALGSDEVLGMLLSLFVFVFFLSSTLLLAWRVALRPSTPLVELVAAWAREGGRILLVSLPLAAAGLVLAGMSYFIGALSMPLWCAAWLACIWVFLPALLIDGLSLKSSLRQVLQTSAQRWTAIALAVLRLLILVAATFIAAFLLMLLLKLLGGAGAAAGGLLLLLPAALLLGILPVLCAFAASRDPGAS